MKRMMKTPARASTEAAAATGKGKFPERRSATSGPPTSAFNTRFAGTNGLFHVGYAKLDIHKKQELRDLVDTYDPSAIA